MQLEVDLKKIGDESTNEDSTASDLIGKVTSDVLELSLKSKAVKEAKNISDGIEEYVEERRLHPIEFCGLSTGFPILDKRIDGLVPGTLAVICARPKNGKSTFLSNVSANVAFRLGKPVLYVDTEMTFNEWRSRILSMMSGVPERKIKHGGYSDQEYHNIQQAIKLIKGGKLFHEYMPGYSIDKLAALYKTYKHIEGIELGIFDYIKAPPGADFSNKKEHQLLGDVTTVLHDLAGELQIPFFCANQINRQDDIADSDRILRYADVLMFFKRKDLEEINNAGISSGTYRLVIKHSRRGGETPSEGIGYDFFKSTLQISEAPVQQIDYSGKEYSESEDIEYDRKPSTEDKSNGEISESDF
jgi:replicative DNA helicase